MNKVFFYFYSINKTMHKTCISHSNIGSCSKEDCKDQSGMHCVKKNLFMFKEEIKSKVFPTCCWVLTPHMWRLLVCCFIATITHFISGSSLDSSYLLSQSLELNFTNMRTRANNVYCRVTYIALKKRNDFLLQQAHCWIKRENKAWRST